jgi:hypothetical protein
MIAVIGMSAKALTQARRTTSESNASSPFP